MEIMKIGGILLLVALAYGLSRACLTGGESAGISINGGSNTRRKQTHGTRGAESWRAITKARMTMHVGDENSGAQAFYNPIGARL
jgi:hypothetical protein